MNEHEMRILAEVLHRDRLDEARRERLASLARSAGPQKAGQGPAPAPRRGRRLGLALLLGRTA